MTDYKGFPCTKCAACCRRGVLAGLPAKREGSLVCAHLDEETNLCEIYETRPTVCRIDDLYSEVAVEMIRRNKPRITREEWYEQNAAACTRLQEEDGMGEEWRVVLSDTSG